MSFTINNNFGAAVALQGMNRTAGEMAVNQNRITTGFKVASTKDDSAAFTIAQSMRGDVAGMQSVSGSLSRAKSVVDVAVSGAEQISDILNQMEAKALQASDEGIDTASRAAINRDFAALRDQINSVVNSSVFNNTNLLRGASSTNPGTDTVSALRTTLDGDPGTAGFQSDNLTVANVDLGFGATAGAVITLTTADGVATAADARTMVETLRTSKANVNTALSTLGSASRDIDAQISFTTRLTDAVESGVSKLVDADLAKESARFQALQVKQQLGIQALSIANQAPQAIMGLFR
ncbi:flagellin [Sandaracinobacteroides saxicola]|uniref:Flagellin n=1 Tax=Sandaracinobacteroides saxicola TaxID=2759707 RepID=A0A7G5IK13_9SPHN|nr:flagellin [Sandaracinobacteroides saxicola]QMW23705.1 flagellin [Sandaracinobacteroides saxicola]